MTKKLRQKLDYLENEKSFSDEKKHFLTLFKGFQLPKIVSDLRVHLYIASKTRLGKILFVGPLFF